MKKLFKNSFMALAVLALGFSACTEQVEYTPAEVPATAQVYFTTENASQIDLSQDSKSFDINVARAVAGEAATVYVTVNADEAANDLFEFPAAIEFADSATTAVYTVAVKDGVTLEYEKYYDIQLALSDSVATPYGKQVHTISVGVPAPWSEWKEYGTGTYNLSIYWGGTHSELKVYYREYLLNDIDAQFYIPGIANSMDLTIDYNRQTGACQVLPQYALTNSNYGQVTVCDIPHYPLQPGLTYDKYPCTFDAEKGLFTLNLIYFVCTDYNANANGSFGNGVETFQLDGYYVPDYSLTMTYRGNYVDNNGTNNAVISTTKGVDVAKYLMTVISADEDANTAVQGMLAGTVPCDTLTEVGFYAYPITASGNYKVLAITFDAEENPVEAHSTDFEFWVAGDSNPWESLGYAMYTDDIMAGFLKEPANYSYRVEVLANKEIPGLYRVMNPAAFFGADTSKDYYIEIDATDPEGVWIEGLFEIGLDLGAGAMSVTSNAWYEVATSEDGATKEDAKVAGLCGIFADNVITFPNKGLVIAMGGKPYSYGNMNGAFKLDLADITATPDEESNAPAARMFNAEIKSSKPSFGGFKKIDNSFLTPTDAVIE